MLAELNAWYANNIHSQHGECKDQADVALNKELYQMMARVHMDQRIYILMLSSVVTCPSMTMLLREKLKEFMDHRRHAGHALESVDLRDAAQCILTKFSERGLSEIAKSEIQAFAMRPGCTPSATNIGRVVDGFRKKT